MTSQVLLNHQNDLTGMDLLWINLAYFIIYLDKVVPVCSQDPLAGFYPLPYKAAFHFRVTLTHKPTNRLTEIATDSAVSIQSHEQ